MSGEAGMHPGTQPGQSLFDEYHLVHPPGIQDSQLMSHK